ncbi:MAG: glycine oxidase ThiO [Terriglobales bacterium]
MKTWDVIIIGGGIIGLSLSIALRKRGVKVLVVERGEPGREASHAAAGMLSDCSLETPAALQRLARASARMYPEFVHELQDESGINVDLRDQGTLLLLSPDRAKGFGAEEISAARLADLEPALADCQTPAFYLKERSVDPRALTSAALKAAKHRDVDISSGTAVTGLLIAEGRAAGVTTDKTAYHAPVVVNCAGAWAGLIPPCQFPTRPVKGQMLCVVGGPRLNHVVRALQVYLVPRSDGRVLIGATVEEAGYDKRTDPATIQTMHRAAVALVPGLKEARVLEDWAGLRPGTPDDLPILGETSTPGYFVAAGHFRDGILLAPVTARVIAQMATGANPDFDLSPFLPARFQQ